MKSFREDAALLAMQGYVQSWVAEGSEPERIAELHRAIAKRAVQQADALIAELARTAPQPEQQPEKPASRYPWDEAPEWAVWAATDYSGAAYWFQRKPLRNIEMNWWSAGEGRELRLGSFTFGICPDWRDSLEARPSA